MRNFCLIQLEKKLKILSPQSGFLFPFLWQNSTRLKVFQKEKNKQNYLEIMFENQENSQYLAIIEISFDCSFFRRNLKDQFPHIEPTKQQNSLEK